MLVRAWAAGGGPGDGPLVIDIDSFIGEVYGYSKQGAAYGYTHRLGYHPIIATRADTGEVIHIRARKGSANTQRGLKRFVEELLARIRRAGYLGRVVIRADCGFENQKGRREVWFGEPGLSQAEASAHRRECVGLTGDEYGATARRDRQSDR